MDTVDYLHFILFISIPFVSSFLKKNKNKCWTKIWSDTKKLVYTQVCVLYPPIPANEGVVARRGGVSNQSNVRDLQAAGKISACFERRLATDNSKKLLVCIRKLLLRL